MKRFVLVDGNALLHRAYHATPPLNVSTTGELVNAVYGFSSMLLRSINELKPDFVAVAWDMKGPTFRHQQYTQYKATRGPADDGLSMQYKRVHEVVEALNIPEFGLSGYEADDLIGTLATQAAKEKGLETIILTGDRDIMQIIDKNIKVLMPKKTLQDVGMYGIDEFVERFGFSPKQLIEYKALAGDQSDNIPGVPGIGDVTATKLVKQFGSIEKLYKNLFGASQEEILARASRTLPFANAKGQSKNKLNLPDRLVQLLAEGAESAVMSKGLATIDINAPIKLDLAAGRLHDYDFRKAKKLFEELEFKSLVARLPGEHDVIASPGSESGINSAKQSQGLNSGIASSATPPRNDVRVQNQHTTDLDLEVMVVLEKMSQKGVLIDCDYLEKLGAQLKSRLIKLEQEIYSSVGHEFNINSPKQLADILFDELHLPVVRKTKTGRSTDEATLSELKDAHPMILLLLEYRMLFKLVSTYIDALPKSIGEDGRIHSTFNVEGAATGRLSSTNPNLQNIPIRGQLGTDMRKAFVAPPGKVLLGADYSQIELRIMAHLADDPGLKKAFQEGTDIHVATAAKIFKIPVDQITKEQRNVGKTMNFATLYGQGARALGKQLGMDYATAKQYIEEYFQEFPKVREWMTKTLEFGMKNVYVETIWGRRRYIPELQAANKMLQSFGERAAINHPVQGTSADMIKKAMVEIDKELEPRAQSLEKSSKNTKLQALVTNNSCQMILQVHDELLFECDLEDVGKVAKMICEKMEKALELSVPIKVDVKVGKNWGEMEKIIL